MMLRTVPSEKCTEIVVGEDHLDEESSELKANLEFASSCWKVLTTLRLQEGGF